MAGCSRSDDEEDKFYVVQTKWSQSLAVCSIGKLHLTSKLSFCNPCFHFCTLSYCWQQGQMPHVIQYSRCTQVLLLRNQHPNPLQWHFCFISRSLHQNWGISVASVVPPRLPLSALSARMRGTKKKKSPLENPVPAGWLVSSRVQSQT